MLDSSSFVPLALENLCIARTIDQSKKKIANEQGITCWFCRMSICSVFFIFHHTISFIFVWLQNNTRKLLYFYIFSFFSYSFICLCVYLCVCKCVKYYRMLRTKWMVILEKKKQKVNEKLEIIQYLVSCSIIFLFFFIAYGFAAPFRQ